MCKLRMELSIIVLVSPANRKRVELTVQNLAHLNAELLLYSTTAMLYPDEWLQQYRVRLFTGPLQGYEQVRYQAACLARYDWILMLHAGEQLDERLQESLRCFDYRYRPEAYRIRFKNLFGNKWLCHGEWGGDYHIRLANRNSVQLSNQRVSERLFVQQHILVRRLQGHILHSSFANREALHRKMLLDASMAAIKYYRQGRSISLLRKLFSPAVAFLQSFILKRGFLDGWAGYYCAKMKARYTVIKYARLRELKRAAMLRMQP